MDVNVEQVGQLQIYFYHGTTFSSELLTDILMEEFKELIELYNNSGICGTTEYDISSQGPEQQNCCYNQFFYGANVWN